MTYGYYWIAVAAIAIIAELITKKMISIWFVPGSIAAIILDLFYPSLTAEIILLFAIFALGAILTKNLLAKNKSDKRTSIDSLIGEKCTVTEKIDNFAGCGQARVNGQIWSARGSVEDNVFEVGETLTVVAIEGVKLICKK